MLSFSSNLPRFSKNFIPLTNLAKYLISSVFEKISWFCLSHQVNDKSTLQIPIIHVQFSLEPIHGLDVTVGTLSTWSEKPKFQSALCSSKSQRSVIQVYYGHNMGLLSSKTFYKLSYSLFKVFWSLSQGFETRWFKLSQILPNLP